MEKVVRNYYSTPIMFAETAFVPHMGDAMSIPPQKFRVSERYTVTGIWDRAAGNVKFGVAICNVNDRFERKIGRELAEKKAETNPICEVPDVQTFEQFRHLVIEVGQNIEMALLMDKYGKWMKSAFTSYEAPAMSVADTEPKE